MSNTYRMIKEKITKGIYSNKLEIVILIDRCYNYNKINSNEYKDLINLIK